MTYLVRQPVWIVYLVTTAWLTSQLTWTHRVPRGRIVHWALNPRISTSALLVHSTIEQWVMIHTIASHAPVSILKCFKNTFESELL